MGSSVDLKKFQRPSGLIFLKNILYFSICPSKEDNLKEYFLKDNLRIKSGFIRDYDFKDLITWNFFCIFCQGTPKYLLRVFKRI